MVQDAHLIRVTAKAKAAVKKEADARGMAHKVIASKVLEWFESQDWALKSSILGQATPPTKRS